MKQKNAWTGVEKKSHEQLSLYWIDAIKKTQYTQADFFLI